MNKIYFLLLSNESCNNINITVNAANPAVFSGSKILLQNIKYNILIIINHISVNTRDPQIISFRLASLIHHEIISYNINHHRKIQ